MKTKVLSLVSVFLLGTSMVFAQSKTEKFEVYGNCGMCESRIEKAAKGVDGVSSADWNQETKILEVNYNSAEVELIDIHKAIAKVGHDTEKVKADDKAYNNLPNCCRYERKTYHKDGDGHGHNHDDDMK